MSSGQAHVIRGNALALPLPDASIDLICTSPPYFGLRSYQDNGEHYEGQLGSEPTPAEFLDALIAATAEMMRVLKPSGSIFVNLGDKYAGNNGGPSGSTFLEGNKFKIGSVRRTITGAPTKSLIGIPWRYAIRCIDELGLILRAEIIWCLSGGARVYARINSKDRPIMLRDLARSYQPESVQLWNGQQWTQVLGWNKTPDDDNAIELELRTGERIGCTPGHQWPTQRGLLRADQITVGDIIQTTTLPDPSEQRRPFLLPDDEIGWLVGLYIAEGSRSGRTIQFAGHIDETIRHNRLKTIATALDGTATVYQTGPNTATCNLSGTVIEGVIDRYVSAGTAKTKHLNVSAWQRTSGFLKAVLYGYLSGDGHYDAKNDRWRLGFCANDEWAADLRTLAARVGAKVSLRRAIHTGSYGAFPGWRGEWRWARSMHHNARRDGEVVAIRRSRARDFYDVGVADEPHLFALASGVLTHNSKPNGLPESVTDRVRRNHEQWFHFVKQPKYFAAVDEIREAHDAPPSANTRPAPNKGMLINGVQGGKAGGYTRDGWIPGQPNPLGKLPGSVWTIPTQPLTVPPELGIDHFAAYPMEWPRRIIQGWTPNGICTGCGQGRRPISAIESELLHTQNRTRARTSLDDNGRGAMGSHGTGTDKPVTRHSVTITGYACACPQPTAPTRPSVILDPFGGTGTTALVAKALGRTGISIDLSADYCRLAEWRCNDPGQLAAALQVEKPEPVPDSQLSLFGDL